MKVKNVYIPNFAGSLDSLHNLDHVLVIEHMVLADTLRLVLHRGAPHQRVLQVFDDGPVDLVAEVLHRALVRLQHHRGLVVRKLALQS